MAEDKKQDYEPPKGMSGDAKTKRNKERFLKAFDLNCAIVSPACRAAKVGRSAAYDWRRRDPVFAAAWYEIEEAQVDMVESNLIKNIKKGKEASTIFYLKSKAKNRGYSEDAHQHKTKIKVKIKKGDE